MSNQTPTDCADIRIEGQKEAFLLKPKVFKTGSKGYHGFGKATFGNKRYQVNILVVEIGSKLVNK